MSVKLRFMRVGKKNHPAYRLCAIDTRKARDGRYIENIGFYDPYIADDNKKLRVDKSRAEYWLSVGAQPSETVLRFFKMFKIAGLIRPKPKRKRRKKLAAQPGAAGPTGTAARKPPKKAKPPKKMKPPKETEAPKKPEGAEQGPAEGAPAQS
jgi:small subunit ribosomal protein S16